MTDPTFTVQDVEDIIAARVQRAMPHVEELVELVRAYGENARVLANEEPEMVHHARKVLRLIEHIAEAQRLYAAHDGPEFGTPQRR